jgi:aryl-alcohol dehydrogenase-like predicted oxidoreductase
MERRIFGRTGMSVSVLGIGSAQFGVGGLKDEAECVRVAHQAFDAGINLIDTADFYGFGKSEAVVGKMIADRRDKVILASKCGMPVSADPNERGGSRRWINVAIERSLKRLGVDHIDIYQLHMPDPSTAIEETIEAMNDLVRAGKIRYFGTSNFSGQMLSEAQLRARLMGATPPHSEQSSYSIFNRGPEAELLPACSRYEVGFLAYSPLDGGWLSGRYRQGAPFEKSPRQRVQPERFDLSNKEVVRKLEAAEKLALLSEECGLDLPSLATGFVLAHPAVACALIGGSSPGHFEAYLDGRSFALSDEILDRIDAIVSPGANTPRFEARSAALADKRSRRRPPPAPGSEAADAEAMRRILALQQRKLPESVGD